MKLLIGGVLILMYGFFVFCMVKATGHLDNLRRMI